VETRESHEEISGTGLAAQSGIEIQIEKAARRRRRQIKSPQDQAKVHASLAVLVMWWEKGNHRRHEWNNDRARVVGWLVDGRNGRRRKKKNKTRAGRKIDMTAAGMRFSYETRDSRVGF
jgi:hypothetical protein